MTGPSHLKPGCSWTFHFYPSCSPPQHLRKYLPLTCVFFVQFLHRAVCDILCAHANLCTFSDCLKTAKKRVSSAKVFPELLVHKEEEKSQPVQIVQFHFLKLLFSPLWTPTSFFIGDKKFFSQNLHLCSSRSTKSLKTVYLLFSGNSLFGVPVGHISKNVCSETIHGNFDEFKILLVYFYSVIFGAAYMLCRCENPTRNSIRRGKRGSKFKRNDKKFRCLYAEKCCTSSGKFWNFSNIGMTTPCKNLFFIYYFLGYG